MAEITHSVILHRLHLGLPSLSRIHPSNTDWVLGHRNRSCKNQKHLLRKNTVFFCLLFIYIGTSYNPRLYCFCLFLVDTNFVLALVYVDQENTQHLEYGLTCASSYDLKYLKTELSCFYCTLPLFINPSLG